MNKVVSSLTLNAINKELIQMEQTSKGFLSKKSTLYATFQVLGWGTLFLVFLLQSFPNLKYSFILDVFLTVFSLFLISHIFRKFTQHREWLKMMVGQLIPRILLSTILLSLIALAVQFMWTWILWKLSINEVFYSGTSAEIFVELFSAFIQGAVLFFFWQVFYFLYHYVNNYNKNLKVEAMVNEFELNKLKSQLNPHFIFNALNSVKALVDEDPERAKESIYQLSSILRNSFMMDKKKVIPFEEELEIVKNYLELEKTRFEERLQVEYEIHPDSLTYKVPPMLLQTVVENGIKHGISKLKNGGKISVRTKVEDGFLIVQIRNSGVYAPNPNNPKSTGYGLRSTKQRLELLYESKAFFRIRNEEDENVLTEVGFPKWQKS
ncbi:MAG: two-component system LytT family sensor kinase [Arenicella sp.]|jgi:two-component system LytT family sensor kinase